ncbi:chorismate--pyruvate lyase family protein [Rickettsiales endosymbiont of Stachyamoeba lipophora]|uniref:chorismate--pyruvate lyase family protein n=1 Tax=Rickettsiales endosymbiont of Stachyamoeba lipophora TaxID=2486578 RepID=UPI000F64CEA6|nr:chorismate lyase [Rickettsiales endosymbiont of Stachyamoeba lipophora]AZL15015.1 chorismate lyase [Rickettsiales endosymbiont of Stachyamoeba lipophora]
MLILSHCVFHTLLLNPLAIIQAKSTTQYLHNKFGKENLEIEVIHEGFELLNEFEQQQLDLKANNAWIREVEMLVNGTLAIKARTVAPLDVNQDFIAELQNLGSKPISSIIYNEPYERKNYLYADDDKFFYRFSIIKSQKFLIAMTEGFNKEFEF